MPLFKPLKLAFGESEVNKSESPATLFKCSFEDSEVNKSPLLVMFVMFFSADTADTVNNISKIKLKTINLFIFIHTYIS